MRSTPTRLLGACLFLLLANFLPAQDTLRVMSYNLLRYGAQGISCTPVGVTARNAWLTGIMGATMPDIFGVNEVGPYSGPTSPANNLLINVLQPLNPAYRGTTVTFNGSQDVANAMYYNSDKVGLAQELVIPEPTLTLRDINYYKFYYKGPGLAVGDTTFIEVVQVHLHASDENTRQVQTDDIMDFLDGLGRSGNFIVQGDLNLDGSTAGSYQNMVAHTNPDCKMNDPLGLVGNWHGNTNSRRAMTQATSTNPPACGAGGSLDDRFDQILVSNALLNGTDGIQAMPTTHWVPGNTYAPNAAVTGTVSGYLKANSDHFPVVMDFQVSRAVAAADAVTPVASLSLRQNPSQGRIDVALQLPAASEPGSLELCDLSGRSVRRWDVAAQAGEQRLQLDAAGVAPGAYLLQLVAGGERLAVVKALLVAE